MRHWVSLDSNLPAVLTPFGGIMNYTSLLPEVRELAANVDWLTVLRAAAMVALVIFIIGAIFRSIFGKGSSLNRAVSATLSILLVYLASVLLFVFLPSLRENLNQLPFLSVTTERCMIWDIQYLSEDLLYPSLLQLAMLALIVNLLETFMPEGEKFLSWYLFRTITVLASLGLYVGLCAVINSLAPQIFGSWAKVIILGFWALILLSGLLKVLLSIILTAINPIIGALYTFFFSNILGKQFSKSILTTILTVCIVAAMNHLGLTQFAFSDFSLASYGPTCVIVVVVLYLFGRLL